MNFKESGINIGRVSKVTLAAALSIAATEGCSSNQEVNQEVFHTNQTPIIRPTEIQENTPTIVWTATPETTPTATPSPTPTETPTPKQGYETNNGTYIYTNENGEKLSISHIPGLTEQKKQVDGKERIIYIAEKNNPYGIEAGVEAGFFYPNVRTIKKGVTEVKDNNTDTELSGGIALIPEVVKVLCQQQEKDGYIMPIPIDLSGIKDESSIFIGEATTGEIKGYGKMSFVVVNAPSGLRITNPYYLSKVNKVSIGDILRRDVAISPFESLYKDDYNYIVSGKEWESFTMGISRERGISEQITESSFGDPVKDINGDNIVTEDIDTKTNSIYPLSIKGKKWVMTIYVSAARQGLLMKLDHIVSSDGSLVFLLANK